MSKWLGQLKLYLNDYSAAEFASQRYCGLVYSPRCLLTTPQSAVLTLWKEVIEISIENVKMKYEEDLMRLPNVTGVGIGKKAGKEVIKVLVTHKVAESALQPEEIVPKTLEGYETDVEEVGVIRAESE